MKNLMILLCAWFLMGGTAMAQQQMSKEKKQEIMRYENMFRQLAKESESYYQGAERASYGVRYLWSYMFDKKTKNIYRENRVLLVGEMFTMDRSYQSMGERAWLKKHYKDPVVGRDSTLANHLTPSFYLYYPEDKRMRKTYRIVTEEFLVADTVINNQWEILNEEKTIGGYRCKKAVCEQAGRVWHAWFTKDLPGEGAPRLLTGLPGVVLEASDADGEITWQFEGVIKSDAGDPLYIKYPDRLSEIPLERFPLILRLYTFSERNNVQNAGVTGENPRMLPEICLPSTGIDACLISNPIERK